MRQYKIVTDTTATTFEGKMNKMQENRKDFTVHGFAHDTTNFLALVSFEV